MPNTYSGIEKRFVENKSLQMILIIFRKNSKENKELLTNMDVSLVKKKKPRLPESPILLIPFIWISATKRGARGMKGKDKKRNAKRRT